MLRTRDSGTPTPMESVARFAMAWDMMWLGIALVTESSSPCNWIIGGAFFFLLASWIAFVDYEFSPASLALWILSAFMTILSVVYPIIDTNELFLSIGWHAVLIASPAALVLFGLAAWRLFGAYFDRQQHLTSIL